MDDHKVGPAFDFSRKQFEFGRPTEESVLELTAAYLGLWNAAEHVLEASPVSNHMAARLVRTACHVVTRLLAASSAGVVPNDVLMKECSMFLREIAEITAEVRNQKYAAFDLLHSAYRPENWNYWTGGSDDGHLELLNLIEISHSLQAAEVENLGGRMPSER